MSNTSASPKRRILFIDALRAYAILMMLQGHFTDSMLANEFRDPEQLWFSWWLFMRGMTAPIFFFTTGMVFIFLLLRNGTPFWENPRVTKGIRRGFFLIMVGYLLRINIPALFSLDIWPSFMAVDVLHCIGLSLIGLVGLYALHHFSRVPFPILAGILGSLIFLYYPVVKAADLSWMPNFLANYFTKEYGSVFTIIPWMGYTYLGGIMGYFINKNPKLDLYNWLPPVLIVSGALIHYYSSQWFLGLYKLTGWQNFLTAANNNFLFWHLGHIFIVVAIVIIICRLWKNMPPLIPKIGQETLTIYALHFVVLYGTWAGFGIIFFGKYSLSPWACFWGAIIFLMVFVVLIAYIEPIRQFLYETIPQFFKTTLRVLRVKLIRYYLRLRYQKA